MTADRYETALNQGAWVNLSLRAKWRLSGADRVRYLNGQVTQDVRQAKAGFALHACVTNLKGKIEGDIFIHVSTDGESLLLDADASLRDSLGARLERYIIADDAVLEDITDEWQLWHALGAQEIPSAHHSVANMLRFDLPGRDLWLPVDSPSPSADALTESEAETLRILRHVPNYPQEINTDTFPPEAGLEATAMSFTKGCYIGQEILSRIKTTGKMPRQLVAWSAEGHVPPAESLLDAEGKEVGRITSVALHPITQGSVGLAYLKQSAAGLTTVKTALGHELILNPRK